MGITSVREGSPMRKQAWAVIDSPNEEPRPFSGSESTVREATLSGFKNAMIAGAVASGPVLGGCRVIPWAKANLNYTAQALLISAGSLLLSLVGS